MNEAGAALLATLIGDHGISLGSKWLRQLHTVGAVVDSSPCSFDKFTISLSLFPPGRQSVKETKGMLCGLVHGHFVLEAAALLGEGAHTLVNPLVAVYLYSPWCRLARTDNVHGCMILPKRGKLV